MYILQNIGRTIKMTRLKAALMMIVADLIVASADGMHMNILITYCFLLALICISPFALIKRDKSTKLTWAILFQAFVCAFFGAVMSQNLFAKSLVLTSATFASAFINLVPPLAFIIAVVLRLEKLEIGRISGKTKVLGILAAVGGATLLTFYQGPRVNIGSTHFSLIHGGHQRGHVASAQMTSNHQIIGSILGISADIFQGLYLNLQSKMIANYPCHYTGTFLFCLCAFIQSFVYAVCTERSWSRWKLGWNARLYCIVFQGVTTVGYTFLIMASLHLQGPLFVSIFNPLTLVFVAIAGFLVLDEKIYVGMLLGSLIVIIGLYMVLWGKSKEIKRSSGSSKDVNDASNTATSTTTVNQTDSAGPSSDPVTSYEPGRNHESTDEHTSSGNELWVTIDSRMLQPSQVLIQDQEISSQMPREGAQ